VGLSRVGRELAIDGGRDPFDEATVGLLVVGLAHPPGL